MFRYRLLLLCTILTMFWLTACAPAGNEPIAVQNTPTTAALSTVPPTPMPSPDSSEPVTSDSSPAVQVLNLTLAGTTPVAINNNSDLTVLSVTDSRCPKGVDCITAGSLVAEISWADKAGNEEIFKIGLQDPAVLDTATLKNGYLITIVDAMPYPDSATAPIALENYLLYVAVDMSATGETVEGDKPAMNTVEGMLYVDAVTIALMESMPQQASAEISGNFADGCTSLGDVTVNRVENTFNITLHAVRPADQMCTQALVPFTQSVPLDLGGLKAGDYKVVVGEKETTFNLAQDNVSAEGDGSSTDTGKPMEGVLYVDTITIALMESMPLQASAEISGNFADGCTSLGDVVVNRVDNTFYISLKAVRPADQMCTQALVPFTQAVPLNIYGLKAGDYKVVVGEVETTFNLAQDNGPVAGDTMVPYDAPIMGLEVVVEKSEPTKVTLKIQTAYIPACETFVLTTEEMGSEIKLKAQIHPPAGMLCRAPTKQMEEHIPLDVTSLTPGSYTVTINGQSSSFEMP